MVLCCVASCACCLCSKICCRNVTTAAKAFYLLTFIFVTTVAFILQQAAPAILLRFPEIDPVQWSYFIVYKLSLVLVIFHAVLCLALFGARSSTAKRSCLQNGLWSLKAVILLAIFAGVYMIPDQGLAQYWLAAMICGGLFILIQAAFLVDLACSWGASWALKYEEEENNSYRTGLFFFTILFFLVAVVLTILQFVFFTQKDGCAANAGFITVNLLLYILWTVVSVTPRIQEASPESGIFQSALLAAYNSVTLTSALAAQSAEGGLDCNSLSISASSSSSSSFGQLSLYAGLFITFASMSWAALSTGTKGDRVGTCLRRRQSDSGMDAPTEGEGDGGEEEATPTSRACCSGRDRVAEEEESEQQFPYSFFHFAFVLAAFYMASVLTHWDQVAVQGDGSLLFKPGMSAMWVKLATTWVIAVFYLGNMIVPCLVNKPQ